MSASSPDQNKKTGVQNFHIKVLRVLRVDSTIIRIIRIIRIIDEWGDANDEPKGRICKYKFCAHLELLPMGTWGDSYCRCASPSMWAIDVICTHEHKYYHHHAMVWCQFEHNGFVQSDWVRQCQPNDTMIGRHWQSRTKCLKIICWSRFDATWSCMPRMGRMSLQYSLTMHASKKFFSCFGNITAFTKYYR